MKKLPEIGVLANQLVPSLDVEGIATLQELVDEIAERESLIIQLMMLPRKTFNLPIAPAFTDRSDA